MHYLLRPSISTTFACMKRISLIIFILAVSVLSASAQAVDENTERYAIANQQTDEDMAGVAQPMKTAAKPVGRKTFNEISPEREHTDTLSLPRMRSKGGMPFMTCPLWTAMCFDQWDLHRGLNVNVGLSVFCAFGKGAPKGAGFGQDVSLYYAVPLTSKLSFALGGWVSHASWMSDSYTDAGLSGVLDYRFDEHWEAYVYGRKSIVSKPMPYRLAMMQDLGDRIGAAVKYNFSPSFSVQVSVSAGKMKSPWSTYDDTFNH